MHQKERKQTLVVHSEESRLAEGGGQAKEETEEADSEGETDCKTAAAVSEKLCCEVIGTEARQMVTKGERPPSASRVKGEAVEAEADEHDREEQQQQQQEEVEPS